MSSKAKAKAKKSRKGSIATIPEPSIAPTSTKDPGSKSNTQRGIISTFQSELEEKQSINDREVKKTLGQIHYLRKDNDRMQRKQTAEYGMTLDMIEEIRNSIEITKNQNLKLFHEMEESKALHDKLCEELKEVKSKYAVTVDVVGNLQKDSHTWKETKMKCFKFEARCSELMKVNKRLRVLLLKHHIDPNTDARQLDKDERYPIQSKRIIPTGQRRRLLVKGRYSGSGDLDGEVNIKRFGLMNPALDQMSPAYWGFYRRRPDERPLENAYYRPGVNLPGIMS